MARKPGRGSAGRLRWVTLAVTAAGLAVSSWLAILAHRIDKDLKSVQSELAGTQAAIARHEARGSMLVQYRAVPLSAFCAGGLEESRRTLTHFVQNHVVERASALLEHECDAAVLFERSQMFTQDAAAEGVFMAFLDITNRSQGIEPEAELAYRTVDLEDGEPVWSYADKEGAAAELALGQLGEDARIYFPVALVSDRSAVETDVLVPMRLAWTSPILDETATRDLGFINPGPWRGMDAIELMLSSDSFPGWRIGENLLVPPEELDKLENLFAPPRQRGG